MDIYYLDYLAVAGRSWLHRLPASVKLVALVLVIGILLGFSDLRVSAGVLLALLLLAISARVPLKTYVGLTLFPLIFLAVLLVSVEGLTLLIALRLIVRVLALAGSVILVLLTTSYPAIFAALGRVLPGGLVVALYFTYRSVFVLATTFANLHTAVHLRGGASWRHPFATLRYLGLALGHVVMHVVETSQRMADSLVVRGFQYRVYTLDARHEYRAHR